MKNLIFALVMLIATLTASAQFSGGNGTQTAPYQITSKADMLTLRDSNLNRPNFMLQSKYFKLMNDITDSITEPIVAYNHSQLLRWKGHFDGDGHRIVLAINNNSMYECALFGLNIDTGSVIENLTVDGYVKNDSGYHAAGIVTMNSGLISNCINLATITSVTAYAAGIACLSNGTIDRCMNAGTIDGIYFCGGIFSSIQLFAIISNCVNTGLIKSQSNGGGIGGQISSHNAIITKCITTNAVEVGSAFVGVMPAVNATITDCFYDIQMCKYKAVHNQDHPGVTGLPTHLLMEELAK
ncbi:MAG: hypothetical protein LBO69_08955 [Ignavibacteria bacterium]|jgi:hypothetical protein|nr:hypothetical protein [Ignavibacteria bacterium]